MEGKPFFQLELDRQRRDVSTMKVQCPTSSGQIVPSTSAADPHR
jgi:hypothetical protein